jgi:hypothetical protein
MRKGEVVIPDDNPGQSLYMTLKDIEDILVYSYGKDHNNPLTVQEVDQVLTTLRAGNSVVLPEAGLLFVPEGGPGLYCAYVKNKEGEGS